MTEHHKIYGGFGHIVPRTEWFFTFIQVTCIIDINIIAWQLPQRIFKRDTERNSRNKSQGLKHEEYCTWRYSKTLTHSSVRIITSHIFWLLILIQSTRLRCFFSVAEQQAGLSGVWQQMIDSSKLTIFYFTAGGWCVFLTLHTMTAWFAPKIAFSFNLSVNAAVISYRDWQW